MNKGDFVQIIIAAVAVSGTWYATKRGIDRDKAVAQISDEANADNHSIALIQSALSSQAAALVTYQGQLTSCLERSHYLEGRVDELIHKYEEHKRVWERERQVLSDQISDLKRELERSKSN